MQAEEAVLLLELVAQVAEEMQGLLEQPIQVVVVAVGMEQQQVTVVQASSLSATHQLHKEEQAVR